MNEEIKELYHKIRRLGPQVFEETNFIAYNGDARPNMPKNIFDRYVFIDKSDDLETREKRIAKLKTAIDIDYEENTNAWIPLERFLESLDQPRLDILRKELDSIASK